VPVPAGQIPARLAGWALAAAAALPVILLVWARPWYDTRRAALATAAERLAGLVQAHAEGHRDQPAHAAAESALHTLRKDFAATPYPPTGLGPSQVAVAKMLSRVEWAGALAVVGPDEVDLVLNSPTARELNAATAQALRCVSAIRGLHLTGVAWRGGRTARRGALPTVGGRVPGVVPHRCRLS
jgi:hypothetical protein